MPCRLRAVLEGPAQPRTAS